MPGEALLMVMCDALAERETEVNRWFDQEHVPDLMSVPGFLSARRYRALQGQPRYLGLYELTDASAVEGPNYESRRLWGPQATPRSMEIRPAILNTTRGVYRHLITLPQPEPADLQPARGLMLRGLEVPREHDEEFQDWYNTEHLPRLCEVSGVVRARRYQLIREATGITGDAATYIAIYELVSPEVLDTEGWKQAVATPWWARVKRFFGDRHRNVYERILPE